ncbi:MAG: hypothetical protein HY456_01355 [Parcubacteria group bacterium]|nr:hypothetical protein [Parcubacteria group bacterium]
MRIPSRFSIPIAIGIILLLGGLGVAIYFYALPASETDLQSWQAQPAAEKKEGCLRVDEEAEYQLVNERDAEDSAVIIVKDKKTKDEKRRFTIAIESATHYHPIELHLCGAYAMREYNYDYKFGKPLPGFRVELWRYDFDGNSKVLLTLKEFAFDFRVSPSERYLVLQKGFLGSSDFSIVFKDLKTLEDVFVLPIRPIFETNPDLIGDIGFYQGWSKDGRYFWADFFGGAPVFGYIRIDSQNWTYELFPAPPDVLGGDQLNIETGWLTVHPGNVWYGDVESDEEEKARRRAQGIGTDLYIYNLFTKEQKLVAHTDEPLHYFRPWWISETELRYEMPNGETRVFPIK